MVKTRRTLEMNGGAPLSTDKGSPIHNMVPPGESAEFYSADEAPSPVKQSSEASIHAARKTHVHAPRLPALAACFQLTEHLQVFEYATDEAGMNPDRYETKLLLLETLSGFPNMKSAMLGMIRLPWVEIKAWLLRTYCSFNYVSSALEAELESLRYEDETSLDFVHRLRGLYAVRTEAISHEWFVDRAFRAVPRQLMGFVIQEARHLDPPGGWRNLAFETLLRLLTEGISNSADLDQVQPRKGLLKRPRSPDRVARITAPARKSSWLETWCGKYSIVYHVTGPRSAATCQAMCQAADFRVMRRKSDDSEYFLLAFNTTSEADQIMGSLPPGSVRVFNPSKN
jgi:hypothetical protein